MCRRKFTTKRTKITDADDLGKLLDALRIERATLVGWSHGGGVVQTIAAEAPQRVERLILLSAVGPAQPEEETEPTGCWKTPPPAFGSLFRSP